MIKFFRKIRQKMLAGNKVRISGREEWLINDEGLIQESKRYFDEKEYKRQLEYKKQI